MLGLTFVTVQHVSTFPSARAMFLSTIHLLFSQQFHPIYYTTENDHFWVEGAPERWMYGSIVINGNVGQHMDKQQTGQKGFDVV